MLMLVLLFDLIIFLASASKFLVWVGPSSCFKSTQCRGKHNWDLYIYIYIFSTSRMVLFGSLYKLSFFI